MHEKTVVLVKPDGYEKKVVGAVIDRFERAGLHIRGLKMVRLTKELLEIWYAHHKDKPFFLDLVAQMTATPVVAIVVAGEDAIQKVMGITGSTDPADAKPGTIRGDYGIDKPRNVVHRSDSHEAAAHEIRLLFKKDEVFE